MEKNKISWKVFKVNMKKSRILLAIVAVVSIGLLVNGCGKEDPEGVVASVNEEDISEERFNEEFKVQSNLIEAQMGEGTLEKEVAEGITLKNQLKEEVLNSLVLEEIISQDAKSSGIEVSEEEVEESIEDMKESMGGEEEYQKFLENQGMDEGYIEQYTRKNILLPKHRANFTEELDLKDDEIEEFFEENKEELIVLDARQIVVETEEEAREILDRLSEGEDFSEIAKEASIDENSAALGGAIEPFQRGQDEEFDEVVFSLEEGELSSPIEMEDGYYIVELLDRRDTLEDLKSDIVRLMQEKEYIEYVQELQEDSDIEIYLDLEEGK